MPLSSITASWEERVTELERGALQATWLRPDSVVEQNPSWFSVLTPSSRQPWLNSVGHAVIEGDEASVRARIAETIEKYRVVGNPFRWRIGPSSRPLGLGRLLLEHGFVEQSTAYGMATDTHVLDVAVGEGIVVEEVTLDNLDDYVAASAAGWGSSPETNQDIREDMARDLQREGSRGTARYYLARHHGQPAGTGALRILGKSGYLLGSSVAPTFRGKGVYRALVARRAEELRQLGIRLVTIQAMKSTSAPICARLGFEIVCEFESYLWNGARP